MDTMVQTHPLVFVVDDCTMYRSLLESLLKREGWDVRLFEEGSELLQTLETETPDLILSDIEMPGMNGFELFGEIRKRNDLPRHIPVVFISAVNSVIDIKKAEILSNYPMISKSLKIECLLQQIKGVFN